MRMLLFTFSLRRVYTSLVSLYSAVILIAFEPFFHFCKFKVKIIKKRRGERKTVVQCHESYLQATKQKCNVVTCEKYALKDMHAE